MWISVLLALAAFLALAFRGRGYLAWTLSPRRRCSAGGAPGWTRPHCSAQSVLALAAAAAVCGFAPLRRGLVSRAAMRRMGNVLPRLGETERVALEAGTVVGRGAVLGHAALAGAAGSACSRSAPRAGRFSTDRWRSCAGAWRLGGAPAARPAGADLGLPQDPPLLRHDHSEGIRRLGLLGHRPFARGDQDLQPFRGLRGHGDGAQPRSARPNCCCTTAARAEAPAAAATGLRREVPCFALTGPEAGSDAAATQSLGIVEAPGRRHAKCWACA